MTTQRSAPKPNPSSREPKSVKADQAGSTKPDLSATGIILLAKQRLRLFHTRLGESFAAIWVKDHFETYRIKSSVFEEWLFAMCFREHGSAPSQHAVLAATKVLSAEALFASPQRSVSVRLAGHRGAIYVALANERWDVVQITAEGWTVIGNGSVQFCRPPGVQPLPYPKRGGTLADLRPFLNPANEDHWILCVSWLVGALRPEGAFPLLIIEGVHGSGKSTISKVLRALIDPNFAAIRSVPKDLRDLRISASNAWCLGYDNLSTIPQWLSDALCGLSTGGGFVTRELFTNDGEKIFEGRRPILLNGIDIGIDRADLLDRAISLTLPTILDGSRETEAEFWNRFESIQPYLLGSLFDAVACTLRRLPEVSVANLPRMADFATWCCAATPALGWTESDFLDAYSRNRSDSNALGLEGSDLFQPIARLVKDGLWQGTATKLLEALTLEQLNDPPETHRTYPRTPRRLSQEIRRLVPSLAQVGITIEFSRTSGAGSERIISITRSRDAGDAATLRS